MANLFNPLNQPVPTLGADTPLADTANIFGTRPQILGEINTTRVNPFGLSNTGDAKVDAFFANSARWKEGVRMTTDSIGFRQKELSLLKERIAQGLAGGADISRYLVDGRSAAEVKKELDSRPANYRPPANTPGTPYPNSQTNNNDPYRLQRGQVDRAIETELAARVDAYIETIHNNDLDDETRKEFLQMYQSGAQAADISSRLKSAVEGKGKYGIRTANEASQKAAMLNTATNKRQGAL